MASSALSAAGAVSEVAQRNPYSDFSEYSINTRRLAMVIAKRTVSTEETNENYDLDVEAAAYNYQAIAFNVSTIALVASVALGLFAVISFQAAFLIGAVAFFIRYEVNEGLKHYQKIQAGESSRAKDVGDIILEKFDRLNQSTINWQPAKLDIFGHNVWMNRLPKAQQSV